MHYNINASFLKNIHKMKLNLSHEEENLIKVFNISKEKALVIHLKMEEIINEHIQKGFDKKDGFRPSIVVEEIVENLSNEEVAFILVNLLLESIENNMDQNFELNEK
jgi:hypothetical protein